MKRAKALGDTVTCKYDKNGEAAKEVSLPKTEQVSAKGTAKVKLTTNEGEVDMELDRAHHVHGQCDHAPGGIGLLQQYGVPSSHHRRH